MVLLLHDTESHANGSNPNAEMDVSFSPKRTWEQGQNPRQHREPNRGNCVSFGWASAIWSSPGSLFQVGGGVAVRGNCDRGGCHIHVPH